MNGQDRFEFPKNKKKDKIAIQLINNLILIPVDVNGVQLTFLLDTGASSTVIFSFEETDSIQLHNSTVIQLRGLGKGEPVDAIKSEKNTIQIGKAVKSNQTIYVVFDGALNFSSRLGVPIHGIIGGDFLKDFVVEVNNVSEILRFYLPEGFNNKKCKKCLQKELVFIKGKPYIQAVVADSTRNLDVNLLIDSGSGDALWLFEEEENKIKAPENAFEDYLGLGINGNIYGKRSKVKGFKIGDYFFRNVNVAYPEVNFSENLKVAENRQGSIGGEILKRFNWTIHYQNKYIQLQKNRYFKDPFHYNMSGLTLQHGSFTVVKERKQQSSDAYGLNQNESFSVYNLNLGSAMEIRLERIYVVVEVRKNSPAEIAGIQAGDEILEVNNNPVYKYKLHELNEMFYAKEGKTMKMKILRNGYEQRVKFELKDL
ncbi:MAG: hypothetical protein COZ75_12860 [Flavobacteriaceae bacterium CG_4_8_14_3_um_filter_34_10]|nr:PDZ domain-containing protein [Flavobacteriia bacterium]OIP50009.1 MAG: hypothetical protein AUK33_08915 [Flavobacteriaceae bacterium CG2_30_34_30]PIQ19415.1 MAG: hypothetical protein COW66_01240 [Flavobacteriaceae bacterium CG18_big_fil_WC_8_21_14_2_50_34_36]PIV51017.1 MAG: hypothetical protein COS19_02685 [Flavobacteriaceae bacterium CG02_land_8_20_14_3_00_34_13]PIX08293.1 MAG: hypothetical protein COZ75_12860 [Flavobacteriaceae bacterium CG_4_8_14_3_um_filter_34_10]PIZ06960.1 MAG: hypoth